MLPLVGAYNFRDLGGYPTTNGGQTAWGKLFRSDTLQELTAEDIAVLRDLGLVSVVDLRMVREVERSGRGPLADEPVRYAHLSVISEGGEEQAAPSLEDRVGRYLWYLEVGAKPLAEAFALMADESAYPMVFHCFAGKDRTGVLAALVLSCLGVEETAIVEDYVLTATRMELIVARLRREPRFADLTVDSAGLAVEAETMEGFLEGLKGLYGGAREWALDVGVRPDQLEAIGTILLEP